MILLIKELIILLCTIQHRLKLLLYNNTYGKCTPALPNPIPAHILAKCMAPCASTSSESLTALLCNEN